MGTLASTSFQCGFIEKAEAVQIFVSPSVLALNTSVPTPNLSVNVDVYKGDKRLNYSKSEYQCSLLTIGDSSMTVAPGLKWNFEVGSDGGFRYTFLYLGTEVNMTIPFTVTVDGVKYRSAIVVQTVKNGTDGSGSNGKNGVYVPPLMLWEDYPSSYYFEAGVPGVDTRLDMVGVKNADGDIIPYYCAESHTKNANYRPGVDKSKWKAADAGVYKCVATELLLAATGRIDFLSGQAIRIGDGDGVCGYFGTPTQGGAILYTGGADESAATFVVFRNGIARWGTANGQRIEIDPNSKCLNVYDASNKLCAVHSGRTIPVSDATEAVTSPSNCNKSVAVSVSRRSDISTSKQTILGATTLTCAGTMTISVPAITMSGKVGDGSGPQSVDIGVMYLLVTVNGVERTRRLIGKLSYLGNVNDDDATISLAFSIQENFAKGDQVKVEVECQTFVKNQSGNSPGYFQASGGYATTNFVASVYRCEFGANGFFLAQDSSNYIYVLFTNNVLHVKAVSGGNKIFGND